MRLNPWWLYARSRHVYTFLAVLLCTALIGLLAGPGLLGVPMRPATTLIYPLLATLPGLALAASLTGPGPELERASPASAASLRIFWFAAITALSTAVVVAALAESPPLTGVILRNHLLALGTTAVAAVVLPPAAAWLPMGLLVAANGIYGTVDMAATAKWWAVLQHPWNSPGAALTALAIGIAGPLLWMWRGSRG